MHKLFLCHASADKPFAERLASDLSTAGAGVWLDKWEIKVGESIVGRIQEALTEIEYLAIVLSPDAVTSKWVQREFNSSLMTRLADNEIRILPILLKECKIPHLISDIKYADFTKDYHHGFDELAAALNLNGVERLVAAPPLSMLPDAITDPTIRQRLFPYTFQDYPDCLFACGTLDLAIVLGSGDRELANETSGFRSAEVEADLFGGRFAFSRHVSATSIRDSTRVADLLAFLGHKSGRVGANFPIADSLCVLDVTATPEHLSRHLILVGAADTNIFIVLASLAFQQKFGFRLPIRYIGDERFHFTCDQFQSDMSGQVYSRTEDSGHMHCGYVLMAANPWAPSKTVTFVVGTRATGTQAALLALLRECDGSSADEKEPWRYRSHNNRFHPSIPARVLRATRAQIADGKDFIHPYSEINVPRNSRISQRHIITDFEYIE